MKSDVLNVYFGRDPALHADMADALRRSECDILYAGEDGVLLCDIPSGDYLVSAATAERARFLAGIVGDAEFVSVHGERFSKEFEHPCRKNIRKWKSAAYVKDTPVSYETRFEIKLLGREHLRTVLDNYTGTPDPAYIEARFMSGMLGAFDGEELAAFIGMHGNGEIGFLHTLEKYRGQGAAHALEAEMTNRCLMEGRIPHGLILPENTVSEQLALNVGYTVSPDRIVWLESDE